MSTAHVWVIGRSGLLGSALTRFWTRDGQVVFDGGVVPWGDPELAGSELVAQLDRFRRRHTPGAPWTIAWAAGASTIGSPEEALAAERRTLVTFVRALSARAPEGPGSVFFASSASVYAGSSGAPFTESDIPHPLTPYARAKLQLEQDVAEHLGGRVGHVLGRISTLYGPGQDLRKGQGLVSTLCLQAAQRRSVSLYVPLDTLRDYLYVDDAAALIDRTTRTARSGTATQLRNVCDGSAVTVGQLVATVRAVNRRRISVTQAPRWGGGHHVRDLRISTDFRSERAGVRRTGLAVGVRAVQDDIDRQLALTARAALR